MKKTLTGTGVTIGVMVGIVLLFLPGETLPAFLTNTTGSIAGALRRLLMPNEDPMGAFLIEIPVLVVITGIIGGAIGLLVGMLLGRRRKSKQTEEAQQPNRCD
jgi:hypothetical protein